jgi:hypothetical protein
MMGFYFGENVTAGAIKINGVPPTEWLMAHFTST